MMTDEYYMRMALDLARKGIGKTDPNPVVGAVLVKNGKVIAAGYHKRAGLAHAEIEALDRAGRKARGSTLYVNLEPCSHFGRTGPCVDRIIKEGVKRVVVGMRDPNPIVNGNGIARLRARGLVVKSGVLRREAEKINRVFTLRMETKRPFVTIKVAQSLDGKIATYTGDSKWITGEASRRYVHRLRGRVGAVIVGVNTVISDDPLLTARAGNVKKQPLRVVLDSRLRIPRKSRILRYDPSTVIIATTKKAPAKDRSILENMGVKVLVFREDRGKVDLGQMLRYLGDNGVSHILVEGGGSVVASFLKDGLADEAMFFISPKIIGGKDAITSVEGDGIRFVDKAPRLFGAAVKKLGEDILVRGYVHRDN